MFHEWIYSYPLIFVFSLVIFMKHHLPNRFYVIFDTSISEFCMETFAKTHLN